MDACIWFVFGRPAIFYSRFFNVVYPELTVGITFKDESAEVCLGLFQNQLRAIHAVVVLRHILLDDQTPITLAYHVPLVAGALPPALGGFEACGYEKAL